MTNPQARTNVDSCVRVAQASWPVLPSADGAIFRGDEQRQHRPGGLCHTDASPGTTKPSFSKTGLLACVVFWSLANAAVAQTALNLMPLPAKIAPGTGRLAIDNNFTIRATSFTDERLDLAIDRLYARIFRQTGIPMGRTGVPLPPSAKHSELLIDCRESAPEYPALNENESYRLEVSATEARLTAQTVTGALRGMETFAQLIGVDAEGFRAAVVTIDDQPRFPWRGLMLDVSRHWMPLPVIERTLDAMAAVKLNVFHWHLSDDQGFRVESRRFPKLHELGSDGNYYTQSQVRHIVAYARDRGIRVVPEFDIPGHATSWFVGYPELASAPGPYAIERNWGIFQPTIDPSRSQTYAFLDTFLGEMSALFPDAYFHIGGDEIDDAQWKRSEAIQAFARRKGLATSHDLHAYFNRHLLQILKKHGKILVGWDEVLEPGLPQDAVIHSWRGQDSMAEATKKGYRSILSFGYYLNHMKTAGFYYRNDPLDGAAGKLDPEQTSRILGGEACMWTEYSTHETVDSRIWPRAAAIAERLWSPAKVKDIDSMYARMEAVSRLLDSLNVQYRSDYEQMLDRLAGDRPVEPVRVLADAVEALGIDDRQAARHYSIFVPLNRLVDAARPESEKVRLLEQAAARFAGRPSTTSGEAISLRLTLEQWRDNHALLAPLAKYNALLIEVMPISENLSALASIGLRALDCLQTSSKPPESWVLEQQRILNQMEKPQAEVVLAAVRPVRILLEAAAKPGSQTTGASR
jgi:hexosaminidase